MWENKKLIQLAASGFLALLFVQFYLKAKEQNIELGFGLVNVLVAAQDIPPNYAITSDLVTTKAVAGRDVEPGAYRVKIPGDAIKRILGKVTVSAIPAGGQILLTNIRNPSAPETGVTPMLPPGKRGVVLRLGNLDVAKLILPGDRIDILATFTVRQKGSDMTSKATYTILQNIQVVAVDKDIIKAGSDVTGKQQTTEGRLLTLALSPVEAEQLVHAQIESQGEISIIVRAHGDENTSPITPVTSSNMLQNPQPVNPGVPVKNH
jgi:Flp pilus assembly protein CpaB